VQVSCLSSEADRLREQGYGRLRHDDGMMDRMATVESVVRALKGLEVGASDE
jgi:hypothetical protein